MIWLFSYKANFDLKARMVIDGSKCIPGVDFNPDEVYCGNVTATSIKIFFALSALYGLILRGEDLVGAYLVTPGSKEFMLCIATPPGIFSRYWVTYTVSHHQDATSVRQSTSL